MTAHSLSASMKSALPIVLMQTTKASGYRARMSHARSKCGMSKYGASLTPSGFLPKCACFVTASRICSICSKSYATVGLPGMFGHARLSSIAATPSVSSARPSISRLSASLSPERLTMYGLLAGALATASALR